MSPWMTYASAAIGLIGLGVLGAFDARSNVVRKVIAINVMGSGVFLLLVASARRSPTLADPVPHALVLTGIVISVSATALALALAKRITDDELERPDDEDTEEGRPPDDPGEA